MKKYLLGGEGGPWRRMFVIGGIVASVALVAFGIGSITVGALGVNDVRDNLAQEQIYFGDAAKDPAVPKRLSGEHVTTGAEAREFAKMMRKHALEATEGQVYAQMGRFLAKPGTPKGELDALGTGTNNAKFALTDPKSGPVSNPARNIWVTETALTTALNQAFFAERVAGFSIIMGIALLLTGIGFAVLTLGALLRTAAASAGEGRVTATPATQP